MNLYVTSTSPYARVARMVVLEKGLADRVAIRTAETRTPGSAYYKLNPSGRVPYLVREDGVGIEDSQLIALYLDSLDGKPRLTPAFAEENWSYGRLETYARSMLDGISVYLRETRRPENERSPTILRHEQDRAQRLADFWDREIAHPMMRGSLNLAMMLLIAALDSGAAARIGDLESTRPDLAAWAREMRQHPSVEATAPR